MHNTQLIGAMVRYTYRQDPKRDPNLVFDVVKTVVGKTQEDIKNNIKYYAMKTGAVQAQALTQEQYEDMIDEANRQSKTATSTTETN